MDPPAKQHGAARINVNLHYCVEYGLIGGSSSRQEHAMTEISESTEDQFATPDGVFCIHYRRRDGVRNELLPRSAFIWIDSLEAKPTGYKLLRKYSPALIGHVQRRFGVLPVFLHAAANAPHGDTTSQERLERYYRSCGFRSIGTSAVMMWPD